MGQRQICKLFYDRFLSILSSPDHQRVSSHYLSRTESGKSGEVVDDRSAYLPQNKPWEESADYLLLLSSRLCSDSRGTTFWALEQQELRQKGRLSVRHLFFFHGSTSFENINAIMLSGFSQTRSPCKVSVTA